MPTINEIWDKYKFTRESGDYIDQERFIEAVAEIISLPVEAQVSQENGGQDGDFCDCPENEILDFVRYCGNCGKRFK